MWKMSKLCHVAYHSTRLDRTKVFILLCTLPSTLDQKAITTNETIAPYEKRNLCYIAKRYDVICWLAIFGSLCDVKENYNGIFGSMRKLWVRNMSFWRNFFLKIWTYLNGPWDWPASKLRLDDVIQGGAAKSGILFKSMHVHVLHEKKTDWVTWREA